MTPKIDSMGVSAASIAATRSKPQITPNAHPAASPAPGDDSVQLTSSARLIQSAQAAVNGAPDIDEHRVADIKAAISEGRYAVNPDRIAANLMRSQMELA